MSEIPIGINKKTNKQDPAIFAYKPSEIFRILFLSELK